LGRAIRYSNVHAPFYIPLSSKRMKFRAGTGAGHP
jgi:hypothetical protein